MERALALQRLYHCPISLSDPAMLATTKAIGSYSGTGHSSTCVHGIQPVPCPLRGLSAKPLSHADYMRPSQITCDSKGGPE